MSGTGPGKSWTPEVRARLSGKSSFASITTSFIKIKLAKDLTKDIANFIMRGL